MKKFSKAQYEEELNEIGAPNDDLKSNGGKVSDYVKYGSWLRKNDPIAFEIGYHERVQEENRRNHVGVKKNQ